ncbi:MAG TPA: squalene/phytoene synthase family protein [Solirubrobacteraceae bacterium]|jgi:phytoene synthase|nr:squalene/phytoene synthase family protein [Solirubrobacteraceae bacterium]
MNPTEAYEHCESLTRRAAANFYYGIRLLPRQKRLATCAVYAFARRIDDIGDGQIDRARKSELLNVAEQALQAASTSSIDPVIVALADAHERFSLPIEALEDLIAGVRMDVEGASYESFEDLLVYCRLVAGSIGRLCLAIFGAREQEQAHRLADDLGVALQLTNILRDLREDATLGRVYIPREDLRRYQVSDEGRFEGGEGQLDALTRFQARRAGEWFDRGLELVPLLDRRSGACVLAMANIYRGVLRCIEDDPERSRAVRVSLPIWEKGWVASRSILTATLKRPPVRDRRWQLP